MIEPCGHRVLVRAEKLEEIDPVRKRAAESGIVFSNHEDTLRAQAGVDRGTVVAVGPSAFKDFGGEAWCKPGDFIAFAKYGGKMIEDMDTLEKFIAMNDEDVIAVLKRGQ